MKLKKKARPYRTQTIIKIENMNIVNMIIFYSCPHGWKAIRRYLFTFIEVSMFSYRNCLLCYKELSLYEAVLLIRGSLKASDSSCTEKTVSPLGRDS